MDKEKLKLQLLIDEGIEIFPYKDSLGIYSIGVGRNLEGKGLSSSELFFLGIKLKDKYEIIELLKKRGLTKDEVFYLLDNDVDEVVSQLSNRLPWLIDKPDEVMSVLSNMTFNMGINGLLKFKNTLALLKDSRWNEAADEMLKSRWTIQVGARAKRLSDRIRNLNK